MPRIPWRVYIRTDLAAEVELLLLDPLRAKVRYGSRGELIESLLAEWIQERKLELQPKETANERKPDRSNRGGQEQPGEADSRAPSPGNAAPRTENG